MKQGVLDPSFPQGSQRSTNFVFGRHASGNYQWEGSFDRLGDQFIVGQISRSDLDGGDPFFHEEKQGCTIPGGTESRYAPTLTATQHIVHLIRGEIKASQQVINVLSPQIPGPIGIRNTGAQLKLDSVNSCLNTGLSKINGYLHITLVVVSNLSNHQTGVSWPNAACAQLKLRRFISDDGYYLFRTANEWNHVHAGAH